MTPKHVLDFDGRQEMTPASLWSGLRSRLDTYIHVLRGLKVSNLSFKVGVATLVAAVHSVVLIKHRKYSMTAGVPGALDKCHWHRFGDDAIPNTHFQNSKKSWRPLCTWESPPQLLSGNHGVHARAISKDCTYLRPNLLINLIGA
jgi:hypothetical protein